MATAQPRKPRTAAKPDFDVFSVQRLIREELAAKEKLSGLIEREILSFIWEQTYAKKRAPGSPAPESARISIAQFARACGCKGKYAGDVIQRALTRLRAVGLIAAGKEGRDQILLYKLTPAKWSAAPKYEPKPIAVVEIAPAADEEETEEEAREQAALPGLEHVALATEQARSISLATAEVEVVNRLPVNVGIDRRIRRGVTQLILREENAGVRSRTPDLQVGGHKSGTPDLQVGGHKLSRAALAKAIRVGLAEREIRITPDHAERIVAKMAPCRDAATYFSKVDESRTRCAKKRERFAPGWLATTLATDTAKLWREQKEQRDRERAAAPTDPDRAVCWECGKLGRFCDCAVEARRWKPYVEPGRAS